MAACIIRAIWSDAPPAPAATTISTGLFGSHAIAGGVTSTMVSAAPAPMQIVLIILSSLDCTHGQRPAAALLVCWSGILPLCARGSRALSGPRLFGNNSGIDNLENLDATIAVDPKSNEACIADGSLNERCYWRRIPALTATPRHFSMSPRMRSVSASDGPGSGAMPCATSASVPSLDSRTSFTSRLSCAMILGEVPDGTTNETHKAAS